MIYPKADVGLCWNIKLAIQLLLVGLLCVSCTKEPQTGEDSQVTTLGSIEVIAQLVEIKGRLIDDPMYDYAHVMKYKVLEVCRGKVDEETLYIAHYNPAKPRVAVADARVSEIGGTLRRFRPADIHRMALEVPVDDYYMGGIINKYFGEKTGPIYWAVWTNLVVR
ncbi:MAG: hypothetical protein ACYS1A_01395 [Planctomycetota bacterium]|jgi:hypothetical protein